MVNEDIINALKKEFSSSLKDGEERKIVIWNDLEREFEDIIDQIQIDGVKVHKLTGNNNFYTKYLIEEQDPTTNYLIYNPIKITDERDNWLIDMFLYSSQFYADKISLLMRELNVSNSLRELFKKYKSFFNAIERRKKLSKLIDRIDTEEQLELSILAVLSGSKTIEFEEILRNVLMVSLEEEENKKYLDIKKYGLEDAFWEYVRKRYGFNLPNRTLKEFFIYLISTVLANYINEEKLNKIGKYIGKNKPNCVIFIDHWMNHVNDAKVYENLANEYEKEVDIAEIISRLDVNDYKDIDILKIFDKQIITYIVDSLENDLEDYDGYIELIKSRRAKHFYEKYENIYEALLNVIEMYKFHKKYKLGIPQTSVDKMFKQYVEEFYKMDMNYRKFCYYYDRQPESNILNRLNKLVENLYVNWYLTELGVNWTNAIDEQMKTKWSIIDVVNQRDFYKTYVKPRISKGERIFVIISDALRYEIGVEIAEKLNERVIGSTNIHAMLSSVPTITKLGMASLLPNETIEIKDDGKVCVDGIDSSGLENRNKILKKNFENSIAVDYHKLPKNKEEFLEALKGYKLIYIYHDTIDATADSGATEVYTIETIEKAIKEILDLVHKITNWLGGVNIYITADHGFIYQRKDLEESDKIDKEIANYIDRSRRSIISKENKDIDGVVKINMSYLLNNQGYYAYMPKSNIRFKIQGEGAKFVHGGLSLQEIVIPVIEFKNIRSTSKDAIKSEKAKIKLINESRKITNSIFTLNFFQTEKISEKVTPAIYEIYMRDENNNIISNIETIIADLENEKPEQRVIKVRLVLKAMEYDKSKKYYLVIKDKDKGLISEEIPFNINLGIISDFEF
ncbi:BREX-1 system phosphatase PglZ type A [Caldicellulosiruptor sp. DIB 104C]|uniref:BREX-1 system phosphatase PglZ type A n=1 Tax=Caldicellulosiruptor sp. DIB 104C TaxID=3019889 RepID=UPI0023065D5A|nr:BREX-1 system phosphatase PglZ type A [Caldicellulosiruptor sp. DIB 104C]